jgi:AraC family transcriptional regulator
MATDPRQHACNIVRGADGAPQVTLPAHWAGLQVGLFEIPGDEVRGPFCTTYPTVLVAQWGRGRRWYRSHGRTRALHTAPGMIEIYPREHEFEQMRWRGEPGQTMAIHLTPESLARLTHRDTPDDLVLLHEAFDDRLQWLTGQLLDAALRGDDALTVESLSLALLGCLEERGSVSKPAARGRGRLSSQQRQRVLDVIDEQLGTELGITQLAGAAGMSPDRFAHCFKLTFGLSPYRFVQIRRIGAARKLLMQTRMPIADIARAVGFSSQSHFTQVFRQYAGTTPARARDA